MADTPPDAGKPGFETPGFPVVGLGASAGGVEALSSFFAAVPAATGMAYVVVTHLGPGHEALLDEILGRQAAIPILRAVEGQALQPDHAYVLSAAAALTLKGNRLHLADRDMRQRHPIDTFLVSLAEDRGPASVGVLLSGGGSDGTIGLQAIRQAGGLTVAQGSDGTVPAQSSMPDTAIAAGMVDLVLPVQQIPGRLVGFAQALARPDASRSRRSRRRRNSPACAARSARCCAPSSAMISPATRKPASCAGCSGGCMCCSSKARRPIWSTCGGSRRRWSGCSRTC